MGEVSSREIVCFLLTLVLLGFKKDLGVVKEVLTVENTNFVCALVQLVVVKLALFAHLRYSYAIGKECYKFLSLFLCCVGQFESFFGVCADQFRSDLVLQSLAFRANVALQKEE